MNVFLWVAGLRIFALLSIVGIVWPDLLQLWRKSRRAAAPMDAKEVTP